MTVHSYWPISIELVAYGLNAMTPPPQSSACKIEAEENQDKHRILGWTYR